MKKFNILIISRHESTKKLLKSLLEKFAEKRDFIDHLEDEKKIALYDIIAGNIPLHIVLPNMRYDTLYIQVSLNIPRELRGQELDLEDLKKYMTLIGFIKVFNRGVWETPTLYDIRVIKNLERFIKSRGLKTK